jgi:hypothetical protein
MAVSSQLDFLTRLRLQPAFETAVHYPLPLIRIWGLLNTLD